MASTAVIPFDKGALVQAYQQTKNDANTGAGAQFLRYGKDGVWAVVAGGGDAEPIANGAQFLVNIKSFGKGYIAWGKQSNKIGESFVPMVAALPTPQALTEPSDNGWQYQVGFGCREAGADGAEMIFRSSSLGGKKSVMALLGEIVERLQANDPSCHPVVALDGDSYIHKKYGKIYTPVFRVVRWLDDEQLIEAAKGKPAPLPRNRAPSKKAQAAARKRR